MNKCLLFISFLLLCFNSLLLAQVPVNDNCSNATFIYLDPSGNFCFNDSNTFASGDGLSNTCDAAALVPLPPGGHEVWYTYVATGTVNAIVVNATGANPAQKLSITVINGNCSAAGTVNVCNTAATPFASASVAFIATPGTQLWFYVTSLEADGDFETCISSTNGFINPGLGCNNATPLCNTYDFSSPGSSQPGSSLTPSCFNSAPVRPFWYKFTVGFNGPLEFTGNNTGSGGFRWALYDISLGCPGTEVACNSIYNPLLPFGMSSTAINCSSSPFCPPFIVSTGKTYALMIDDTSQSNSGFDLTWGNGVILQPTANFSVDSVLACGSLTADFTDNSSYTTATNWSFNYGDGSPLVSGTGASLLIPSHNYGPGTYLTRLTLSVPSGCTNTFSRQIVVKAKPTITFTSSDDSLCFDGTNSVSSNFTASSSLPSVFYDWIFPNNSSVSVTGLGQATSYWNTSGIINVGLQITENGCNSDTVRDTIYIFDLPTGNFTLPDSGCTGTDITVNYTGNANAGANYGWSYGGGTLSNQSNQQFDINWNSSGTKFISLSVEDNGCIGFPYTDSIKIFTTPIISIQTPPAVCEDVSTLISPLATSTGTGNVFTWDFGTAQLTGGNPSNGSSGTFIWNNSGSSFMTAIALSPEGCLSNKDSVSIVVNPKPVAGLAVSDTIVCGNDSVEVTYTGTMPPSGNNFTWDFGTANILSTSPTLTGAPYYLGFPFPGTYQIYLLVNDNVCNSDTVFKTIEAGIFPNSFAGSDLNVCSKETISLGTTSTAGYNYEWTPTLFLNNANISNPQATVNIYGITDTIVTYIVTTSLGFCSLNDTMLLSVKATQQAYFIPPDPQCELGNSFDFAPFYGIVPGTLQTWIINTDTITAGQLTNYTFNTSGPQSVILQTQTPGCLPEVYASSVTVKPNPPVKADCDLKTGCTPFTVTFQDLSPVLPGASYLWNFGDGVVSFLQNPNHLYTIPGNYQPTLTITSADTCSGTDTISPLLSAFQAADAAFLAQPLIASNLNPNFTFNAVYGNANCYFDFGDGSGDSSCFTSHTYSDTGTYLVTLYSTNAGGCADTFSLSVEVRPNFSLYIPNAFTPNSDQLNDFFSIYSEGTKAFTISIFNRRGQKVWESNTTSESWNGKYFNTGEECPSGIYVYEAMAKDFNNKNYNFRGRITVIR